MLYFCRKMPKVFAVAGDWTPRTPISIEVRELGSTQCVAVLYRPVLTDEIAAKIAEEPGTRRLRDYLCSSN
jgi:hypothetical protein